MSGQFGFNYGVVQVQGALCLNAVYGGLCSGHRSFRSETIAGMGVASLAQSYRILETQFAAVPAACEYCGVLRVVVSKEFPAIPHASLTFLASCFLNRSRTVYNAALVPLL